jgi:hypothetical protein
MSFFAEFHNTSHGDYRLDTRIYLDPAAVVSPTDSPIGAIVAKNPGSAKPNPAHGYGKLAPLLLHKDNMLPTVRNVFATARKLAISQGRTPDGNYVQVLNLSYFCNPDISVLRTYLKGGQTSHVCSRESTAYPVVWYAWGPSDSLLNPLKTRFSRLKACSAIFYDYNTKEVKTHIPTCLDFVKHPQGMPHFPFINDLAKLL